MGKVFIEKNMNQQIIRFGMTLALTLCQFWILIWNKAVPPSTACILMEHDKKLFHILFGLFGKILLIFFFFTTPHPLIPKYVFVALSCATMVQNYRENSPFTYHKTVVPNHIPGGPQHCTFFISPLSDTPNSGLGISINDLNQVCLIRVTWKTCSVGGSYRNVVGNHIRQCSESNSKSQICQKKCQDIIKWKWKNIWNTLIYCIWYRRSFCRGARLGNSGPGGPLSGRV